MKRGTLTCTLISWRAGKNGSNVSGKHRGRKRRTLTGHAHSAVVTSFTSRIGMRRVIRMKISRKPSRSGSRRDLTGANATRGGGRSKNSNTSMNWWNPWRENHRRICRSIASPITIAWTSSSKPITRANANSMKIPIRIFTMMICGSFSPHRLGLKRAHICVVVVGEYWTPYVSGPTRKNSEWTNCWRDWSSAAIS
jgi:hypothetical protein